MKNHDCQQIQSDIQHGGNNQKDQRASGIPQGTDDPRQKIIEIGGGDPQKNNKYIPVGLVENIRRRIHPDQNIPAEQTNRQCHNGGKENRKPDTICYKTPQHFFILCPKALGHRDGKSVAHTHTKTYNHKIDGAGGAHCCQRLCTKKLSHDDHIHQTVKLLKQHTKKQWYGKAKDQPDR